jgi:hypothetical protein
LETPTHPLTRFPITPPASKKKREMTRRAIEGHDIFLWDELVPPHERTYTKKSTAKSASMSQINEKLISVSKNIEAPNANHNKTLNKRLNSTSSRLTRERIVPIPKKTANSFAFPTVLEKKLVKRPNERKSAPRKNLRV